MTGRIGGLVRAAVTTLTALVLAHNLVFLAGYGEEFGDVMARTGHDHGWTVTVVVSLLLGLALLAGAIWRLHQLRRVAQSVGATHAPIEPDRSAFLRRWLRRGIALSLAVAALFVLQENVELARVGQHQQGIGVLASAAYPNAVLIIAAVAMAVSFVTVLLGWKIDLVLARIRAVQSPPRARSAPALGPVGWVAARPSSILGNRLASRAPPMGLAS
jgi:hypothetical protein